jgi:hypothetical protein
MEASLPNQTPPLASHTMGLLAWMILLAIVALAASLRFFQLSRDAFWLDESYSLQAITGHNYRYVHLPADTVIPARDTKVFDRDRPAWTIWTTLGEDTFPPLYYLLLRGWVDLFGDSDFAIRFLSALLSVAAVVAFFDVLRLTSGTKIALWGACVMAIAGAQIQLSREARAYALVLLLSLLACDALVRIERFGPSAARWAGLTASAIGVMLSHYFAYSMIGALGLYALIRLRGRARTLGICALIVATVLVTITWGPFLRKQLAVYSLARDFAVDPGPNYFWNGVHRLAQLPDGMLASTSDRSRMPLVVGLLFLFGPIVLAIRRREAMLWILLLVCVIGALFALDWIRGTSQLSYIRYTVLAMPALYALLVTAGGESWLRWIVPPLIVFAAMTSLPYVVWPYRADAQDWRAVAARIAASTAPGDVLVYHGIGAGIPTSSRALFLCISRYLKSPHPVLIIDDEIPSDRARTALAGLEHFWLISNHKTPADTFPAGRSVHTFLFPGVCAIWDVSIHESAKASPR